MRKVFLEENFLLESESAIRLYHEFARDLPIIDYHGHLPPEEIAGDIHFKNLTEIWLKGDHYKWRAMRTNGVGEEFITGNRPDEEKFEKWAETVPYTLRNPLYHWTHLELQRYFGIHEILSPLNARKIYEACGKMLQTPSFSVRNLIQGKNVELICTTDDPLDTLASHQRIHRDGYGVKILPTFRPDKSMQAESVIPLNAYIDKMEILTGREIQSFTKYLEALKLRHDYFDQNGCSLSDHGLERMYFKEFTETSLEKIFKKIRRTQELDKGEIEEIKSALLYHFAIWDHEKGWVQQFHLGALRNNSSKAFRSIGPDSGFDSIGDWSQAESLSRFFNSLDSENKLAKTIVYNLNPSDNEVIASMVGNFNDGSFAGKMQFGSAWWFLDQKDGMTRQLNTLSNLGLISRMVGMLTDSRSFLSFPRHEYFRRILCNLFARDMENGELPYDLNWIGKIIQDISYFNAKNYFKF